MLQNILAFVQSIIGAIMKAFGAKPAPAPAPVAPAKPVAPTVATVTAEGVNAIETIFGPLVDIVRGKGSLKEDQEAVNAIMNVVAFLNPEAAPVIGLVEAAEPAIAYLIQQIKNDPAAFAPAPRGGPPITEADWSHGGFPSAQPNPNPSGAIGD